MHCGYFVVLRERGGVLVIIAVYFVFTYTNMCIGCNWCVL